MDLLTAEQIEQIYATTDRFGLNRQLVIVPMSASETSQELVLPDGKLFLRAPEKPGFDSWLAGLTAKVAKMDLARARRPTW